MLGHHAAVANLIMERSPSPGQPKEKKTFSEWVTFCEARLAGDTATAQKRENELADERRKRAEDERRRIEEGRKKIAAIVASLKGDRQRIYQKEGEPSDYSGTREASPEWIYRSSLTDAPHRTCTKTYRFKGDKLVDVKQHGNGC